METTVDELRALAESGATILNVGKHGGHREIRGAVRYRPHDLLTPDRLAELASIVVSTAHTLSVQLSGAESATA